ncbi:LPXTG cell wall anchor domain-containing protein [Bacillus pseudomycoides]|nr:LPXTG cell wall anchor domain-containing protein [Bacillus pseudomycoides]
MKNDNRELPNAGGTESNTMPLGMLSILGGIILIMRNRIKNTFQ